ncbi:EF-hand calcium-binding domain-containing protein 12-like [Orbicella faveolata]|uniref:EF-hand calcium-binding domain-containing protein 12-like n=2 Tax=Orbicella faveolata TaxID=48498 RepID=UPI0009E370F0|nr:EF-hand calcium-binding domain-containing protein 12-like [Orbicella faveolata]
MNLRISEPEGCEGEGIKPPKARNLLPSKKYRESVKRWGEPTELKRKRVIIVPSIKCAARDVSATTEDKDKNVQYESETDSFSSKVERYKKQLQERKKTREILNRCGLKQDWLTNKTGRTELESRVLKRMLLKGRPEITIKQAPTPPPEIEEDTTTVTGEDRGVPTIRQPSPAALAVIQEYLDRKRMRLLDLFSQADKDKNWVVSRQEFRNIIRSWRIPLKEVDLEDLILALDRDNSDALDYRELAVGRQSYLEERVTKQAAEIVHTPSVKAAKRPETIPEEPEPVSDPLQDKWPSTGAQRPASPQRPSSPQATTQRRPSTSPQRPYSPSSAQAQPVTFVGQRPGSEPQQQHPRPASPVSNGSSESNMSPTLLEIPAVQLSEKVEQLTQDEIKNRRMKKQQKRKEKEKAKQRKRAAPEKVSVAPSTLGGRIGEMVDRYRKMTVKEYNDVVELCHMHGVQLSKGVLGRVLLQPEDKPLSQMKLTSRNPGLFAISTRHHIPASKPQSTTTASNPRRPKFRYPGPTT